ncbi:MAG: chromosomal replication initiator protein DnaA [Armatimonadota bacterium]|nr:MAG: chromosomal replication initiator protein DnaA [Armatimonadota bacterium]
MPQNDQLHFGEDANLVALRMAWERTLNALSSRASKPVFDKGLKTVVPISFEDSAVVLGVQTSFAKFWIEQKFLPLITELLSDHLGTPVRVTVRLLEENPELTPDITAAGLGAPIPQEEPRRQPADFVLNESFTFDTFVVGQSNRMAHAASCAVAESPGASYNPLFIYGDSGLGKTHLLHAIGNFIRRYHPQTGLIYTTAETFTSEYVAAVSERRTAQFRRRYRSVDVWLVDDIQFLAGKERTKEEFFHTFNALQEVGRQIVLTSDRPPKDLQLDVRLSSRFEAGLVVDIAPPELETRMAIIKAKAQKQDLQIPPDVVLYIARLIRSNIRAIEGALLKLHAYATVMQQPVSSAMASDILSRYFEHPQENLITPDAVLRAVAERYGVDVENLKSLSRQARVVLARQVAMYLIRHLTDTSLPSIGKAFGGKDHSTVLHAIKKIGKLVLEDAQLADDIAALMRELKKTD